MPVIETVGSRTGWNRNGRQDSPEQRLRRFLDRIPAEGADLFVVHVQTGSCGLDSRVRRGLQALGAGFQGLATAHGARLFALSGGELILVCGPRVPVEKIEALLSDNAPEAASDGVDPASANWPTTWYDLADPADLDRLKDLAERREADCRRHQRAAAVPGAGEPSRRLDPARLAHIVQHLGKTEPEHIIRSETVVRLLRSAEPVPCLYRYAVSLNAISARFAPGVDLGPRTWLQRALLERADRLVLGFAERLPAADVLPYGIDVHLAAVSTPAFRRLLDAGAAPGSGAVVVGLPLLDAVDERVAYERACRWVRERGGRVLLAGLSPATPAALDIGRLEPDLVALDWHPDAAADLGAGARAAIAALAKTVGPENVILTGADTEAALEWGATVGIRCFQGRFVDRLLGVVKPAPVVGTAPPA
ncbi:MAG: hypothetical protein EA405_01690 [Rhodospirillales bacterium]|nr:MAG: hypothetical protein EA405_01690 [Rhodospirillales bacterium]